MMNKMKQALALLLALVMMATLIPLGAVSVLAAGDNLVQNGDFESGKATTGSSTRAPTAMPWRPMRVAMVFT